MIDDSKKSLFFSFISAIVLALGSTKSKADAVQWPAGQNICQGIWSYSEYQSCEDSLHGDDLSRPIVAEKDGQRCGYEKKKNSCWHGREHNVHDFIDTPAENLTRDTPWQASELQAFCDAKGKAYPLSAHQLLGTVTVSTKNSTVCAVPTVGGCARRLFTSVVQCRINIDHEIYGPSDSCGPYIDDTAKPKTCVVGYHKINKRSSACQSLDQKTGRMTNASDLMKEDWRYNFSCSTGDDLPADTADQVQKKFSFLVKKIQETQDAKQLDFEILTKDLSTLLAQKSQYLNQEQISYANKVASREVKVSKISEGIAFDVAKECASNGSGRSRFCPSKRIIFDFDDTSHLLLVASFTSIAHRLRYSFQCDASTQQLSVRLIEGDNEFSLATTPGAVTQSTSIVHVPGQRPPQIEIIADRNAFFSDSCQLKIEWSSLDLDPSLLLKSSNDLIDKLKLLVKFKTELDKSSQLSTKYNTVTALKSSVADAITEDIFGCQDLATAAGKDADMLCPLNDDPAWACSNATLTESGKLGVIIKRMHENSCLYKGLEEGLPETVPCSTASSTSSGNQCLAGIQKVAGIAKEEYEKSRTSAESLQKALSKERSRVALKAPDIAKKISIVIDSLNAGLAESSNPDSPLRNRQ